VSGFDFAIGIAVGVIVAGLTIALLASRARMAELAARLSEQEQRLAALERVDRNPLYRSALEDQRAQQLRAASDVATGVEFMIQAIRTLNPELLKRRE
jgi:hypothetical protein